MHPFGKSGVLGANPILQICDSDQLRDHSSGVSEAGVLQANLLKLGREDIGEGRVPRELKVLAVFEAQLFASGENERVVPVGVSGAVAASVEEGGVVEKAVAGFRSCRGVSHPGQEVGELGGKETIPFAERFHAVLFIPGVSQSVKVFSEAEELREFSTQSGGVAHAGDLVGGDPGGVGLKSQMDQLIHCANILLGDLVIRVELKAFTLFVGQGRFGDVDPGLGLFDVFFHLPDRVHIFVELLLVVITKLAANAVGIFEDVVEKVGGTFESAAIFRGVRIAGTEEAFVNTAGLIDGRNRAAVFVEGESTGSSGLAHSTIGGHDQRVVTGLAGIMLCDNLIHGLNIPQLVGENVPTSKECVSTVVSVNLFGFRVRESAKNSEMIAMRFQWFETLVELKVLTFAFGEPVPVLFVFLQGERDSERKIDNTEPGGRRSGLLATGHAVQHRKGKTSSCSPEKCASTNVLSPHYFVKKASLVTMLSTSDCKRRPFFSDFFVISSTNGSSENSRERPMA